MPQPRTVPSPTPPTWPALLVLAVGTGLLYTRSLGYDFINYDDPLYITNNAQVQAGLTWDGVIWAFTGKSDYWHPLTWISHMIDWQLFGAKATGHRAVNVLWHAANAGLVFMVMRRLGLGWWIALFSAALFAWHPLRVESVVWVTERKDVMSGFFFLLTLLAYARYTERLKNDRSAREAYWTTLALFLGGLMCKPSLVTLPLVLLALDFWPLGRLSLVPAADWWRKSRCVVLEKVPFLGLSTAISYVTIRMQVEASAFTLDVPLADRLGNAAVSVARYLGHFLRPIDLAIFYEHPGAWPGLVVAGALALLLLLTVYAWWRRTPMPWLLTGWLWFLAMLLPTLGLLQVGLQAMADRYTYLSLLGVQLALLGTLRHLPLPGRLQAGSAGIILAVCGALTWHQQKFWRNSGTLYQHAISVDPTSSHAEAFLGYTYQEAGALAAAEPHARRALELNPANHWAWLTLANVQSETGRLAEAVDSYDRLIELNPRYLRGYYLRGKLLQQLMRLAEAEASLIEATRLAPDSAEVLTSLAEVQARRRKFLEAVGTYEQLIRLRPNDPEAHAGLGYMLALTGRKPEAARHWQEALRLNPDFPGLRERLRQIQP